MCCSPPGSFVHGILQAGIHCCVNAGLWSLWPVTDLSEAVCWVSAAHGHCGLSDLSEAIHWVSAGLWSLWSVIDRGCLLGECMLLVTMARHRPLRGHPLGECRLMVTLACHRPVRGCPLGECMLVVTLVCHRPVRGCLLWVQAHSCFGLSQTSQKPSAGWVWARGHSAAQSSWGCREALCGCPSWGPLVALLLPPS